MRGQNWSLLFSMAHFHIPFNIFSPSRTVRQNHFYFLRIRLKNKMKTLFIYKFTAEIDNYQHQRKGFRLLKKYQADMANFLAISKHCGMLWSDSLSPWVCISLKGHWYMGLTSIQWVPTQAMLGGEQSTYRNLQTIRKEVE